EHLETTTAILEELGLSDKPRLRVYNKADCVEPEGRDALAAREAGVVVSGREPASAARLLVPLERALSVKKRRNETVVELDDRVAE
ncbi:MAG TPA: hypothetical protein VFZ53_03025, partial [Polyangiaceae bacterium]